MLGSQIGEETGQTMAVRVLPGDSATMETSFRSTGQLLGVATTGFGTYVATLQTDGTLSGDGQGIVMGASGEVATWRTTGVGRRRGDGGASFRGASYYRSSSPGWEGLNGIAVVFEYEADADGNSHGSFWEWT